jgi:uncharacterized damage-inducible protein DinB
MKTSLLFLSLVLSLSLNAQQMNKDHLLTAWSNHKAYTMELAQTMPDSLYDFKPTEDQMTFGEQLMHMVGNMDRLGSRYLGTPKMPLQKEATLNKAYVLPALSAAYELLENALEQLTEEEWAQTHEFFAGPMTGQQIVHLIFDHQTHHRGQLIVYLRLNDLTPPRYRGW